MSAGIASPSSLVTASAPAGVAWWRQLGLLMQWQARRSLHMLPLLVLVQLLLAVATVIGYGLLIGEPDRLSGLYLATGAPTAALIMVGLVMTPQWVSQARTEGSLDWMRTLPISREIYLFADLAVWSLIALPGISAGVIAGALRFDVELAPAWWLVVVVLLVSLTAASIGYALACLLPPTAALLISQVFVFLVMLFTPISFPADRMPAWAQSMHDWLPLQSMAELMRGGLVSTDFPVSARAWIMVVAWCAVSVVGAGLALRRRG